MRPKTPPSAFLYTAGDLEVAAALMRLEVARTVAEALPAFRNDIYWRSGAPDGHGDQPVVDVTASARRLLATSLVAAAGLTHRRGCRVSCAWDEVLDDVRGRTWFYLVRDLDSWGHTCMWVANPVQDWFWWLAFRRDRLVKLEKRPMPEGLLDT